MVLRQDFLAVAILVWGFFLIGTAAGTPANQAIATGRYTTVCQCQCCYLGDCVTIPNTTQDVQTCGDCRPQFCESQLEAVVAQGNTPHIACLALSAIEMRGCGDDPRCKRTTSIAAKCVDRSEFFQKYSCASWLFFVATLVCIGIFRRITPKGYESARGFVQCVLSRLS